VALRQHRHTWFAARFSALYTRAPTRRCALAHFPRSAFAPRPDAELLWCIRYVLTVGGMAAIPTARSRAHTLCAFSVRQFQLLLRLYCSALVTYLAALFHLLQQLTATERTGLTASDTIYLLRFKRADSRRALGRWALGHLWMPALNAFRGRAPNDTGQLWRVQRHSGGFRRKQTRAQATLSRTVRLLSCLFARLRTLRPCVSLALRCNQTARLPRVAAPAPARWNKKTTRTLLRHRR